MKYNVEIDGLGVEANCSEESIEKIFLPLLERLTKMRAEKNRRKSRVFLETKETAISRRFPSSGESGIRTHAPLRTNGFQDRLVMTTSISLPMFIS